MLRTEADLLRTLAGAYTLPSLYQLAEDTGLADRPGGRGDAGDGQARYKRRMRSALYAACRHGRAHRRDQATWLIQGSPDEPMRCLLVWLPREPSQVELLLGDAAETMRQAPEPVALVVADPPWGLERGGPQAANRRVNRRDHSQVVPGYVDVPPEQYMEFTAMWLPAAAEALQPGGYLAIVTGPQQEPRVRMVAEDLCGLTYVNSIMVERRFPTHTRRRLAHAHWVVSLLTRGPLDSRSRVWNPLPEFPRGRNGGAYAVDMWRDIPEVQRTGLVRYDNELHPMLPGRLMRLTTHEGDLVADPFLGGGSTAYACLRHRRRFYGGDLNPHSLRYVMARVVDELVPKPGSVDRIGP